MAYDIIYDLVVRVELPAQSEMHAYQKLKERLANGHEIPHWGAEVIQDDNLFSGRKDDVSRHRNGYVILSSRQKHELLSDIRQALEEASKGNVEVGNSMLERLYRRFDYLSNRNVPE